MLKKILPFLFIIAATGISTAQVAGQSNSQADTVYKKILLVPYNPMMHLSDADHDIAEYSQTNVELVRAEFRHVLLQSITTKFFSICEVYPLLSTDSKEMEKDLKMIYGSISYEMDTVFPVSHPVKDTAQKKKSIFSKNHSSKVKEIHDLKYMNIKLSHPELLANLYEKYHTDLFVFLNQFEIKTNYDDCLDYALKIYRRQLKVHYSVFDVTGKQLYGDVAVVDFPSNSNAIEDIMKNNFPKLADSMFQNIPKKK